MTIIVLLILAGIAINLTIGNNGIFKRAQDATKQWDKASVTEEFSMILGEYQIYKLQGGTDNLENFLLSKGADEVIDNGDGTLDVEYKGYTFTVDSETLEIEKVEKAGGVKPEIETSKQVSGDNKTVTITVKVTNEVGSVDSIELYGPDNNQVTGTVDLGNKTATYTVNSNGKYTAKVRATTEGTQKSGSKSIDVNDILVEFSTDFGRIEVIWIDQNNQIINEPLSPASSLKGMTPVKWNGTEEVTTTENDPDWYRYVGETGKKDNLSSRWANAKNTIDGVDSYFVWIPRYAYKITYYADENSDVATGYYDGRGMVDTLGNVKNNCTLEEGIETVEKDGKSYIVHPAFMNDYTDDGNDENDFNLGGWDSDLRGIWVGKYEASKSDATSTSNGISKKIKIQPNVSSWRNMYTGQFYTQAHNYDRTKESHLIKNSEWGAVAYLTHSQYGRNGHEIDINNSLNYITGNGGGSTDANGASGITNAYDTEMGQKASSTGNIYGIYDLSGGAWEAAAAFDNASTSTSVGKEFASKGGKSTKYATAYTNGTDESIGVKIYEVGKTGDTSKELYNGKKSNTGSWNDDFLEILCSKFPFPIHGGDNIFNLSNAGVFALRSSYGTNSGACSFRVVCAGAESQN